MAKPLAGHFAASLYVCAIGAIIPALPAIAFMKTSRGLRFVVKTRRVLRVGLLPLLLALTARATASEPEYPNGPRVFVCAHSFMIFTSKGLPDLAKSAGLPYVFAGKQMLGGSRVIQHWNLPDDQNRAKAALKAGSVDILTVSPHLQLPDDGIDNFTRLGLQANPKLKVLVQASWPPRDGKIGEPFTNAERDAATVESLRALRQYFSQAWITKLEAQVRELNRSIGHDAVFIVPVGDAVFALRERIAQGQAPGITRQSELFRDDLGHPAPTLAALVTYCHFAAIYQRSPVGLPVPAELKAVPQIEQLNPILQQIAWDTVSHCAFSGVKADAVATGAGQ